MAVEQRKCPKCHGEMAEGFVPDFCQSVKPPEWFEGTPERSFWTGVKLSGKARFQIRTYRCVKCGYLESYASQDGPG